MTNLTQTQTVNDNAIHAELAQAFAALERAEADSAKAEAQAAKAATAEAAKIKAEAQAAKAEAKAAKAAKAEAEAAKAAEQAAKAEQEAEAAIKEEVAEAAKVPTLLNSISRSASIAVASFGRQENETLGDWSSYVHLAVLHGESGKQAQKALSDQLQKEEPVKRIETLLQIMNQLSSVAQAADEASRSRIAYQQVMYFSRKMETMAGIRLMKLRGGDWVAVAVPPKVEQPEGAVASPNVQKTKAKAKPKAKASTQGATPEDFALMLGLITRLGLSAVENLALEVAESLASMETLEAVEAEEQQA